MEAYLPMSSGEWGEAGVGESTFHEDSKDVLASAFGLHGTLIVRPPESGSRAFSGEALIGPPHAARPKRPRKASPSAPLGGAFAMALLATLGAPVSPCRGARPAVLSKCQGGRDDRRRPP